MTAAGLVSVTFRKLSPEKIVDLVAAAGLAGIEWGGDIHVPHGDLARARSVRELTNRAGLAVAAYGSYYRLGNQNAVPFDAVLNTARELGTTAIRVWAGPKGSAETDAPLRAAVVADTQRCAEAAARAGCELVTEWHAGTLTDTAESATQFFKDVNHPAMRTYWQPRRLLPLDETLLDMDAALARLVGLHVFYWDLQDAARLDLESGLGIWRQYLAKAAAASPRWALLEFVKDDAPDQFIRDAASLRKLLA